MVFPARVCLSPRLQVHPQLVTWMIWHDQVADNAEPAADAAVEQGIKPAGEAVAKNARPVAEQATKGYIRPAGEAVSKNAVPMTKGVMRDQVGSHLSPLGLPKVVQQRVSGQPAHV